MGQNKVLFVITKSVMYGAGRYVYDLATNLPAEWTPAVVAGGNGPMFEKLKEKNVRTLTASALARDVGLTDAAAIWQLYKIFKVERPDVVHLNSSKAGGIGAVAARMAGVPHIIFTVHGFAYNETWRSPLSRALIYIASWLTALFCHKSILIVQSEMQQWPFASKSVLIHNGIAPVAALPHEQSRAFLTTRGVPATGLVIGTLAELHKNKAHDVLIEAVAKTHGAVLVIIGEGEERKNLEALIERLGIKDRVFLLGYVAQASQYLSGFDIFTLPSLKEGLSYAVLEAGSAGLPIVATNIGGMPDIIADKKDGLLVPPKDAPTLATALQTLIDSPALRASYGSSLRTKISSEFSLSKMVSETVKVYGTR